MPGFNFVYQLDRLALRRDQVEPAPRHHQTRRQSEHAIRNRIAMMMVVEQPRVDIAFAQRRLYGGQVHGQTSIVNKRKDLSESPGTRERIICVGKDFSGKGRRAKVYVGTAAFGCPVERSSTEVLSQHRTEPPSRTEPSS